MSELSCKKCGGHVDRKAKGRGIAKVVYTCQECGQSGFYSNVVKQS